MPSKHGLIGVLIALSLVLLLTGTAAADSETKININTASVDELVQLERVGQRYAERIVAYREEHGPFKAPEDIMLVAGIGPKTFEANKNRIIVK